MKGSKDRQAGGWHASCCATVGETVTETLLVLGMVGIISKANF